MAGRTADKGKMIYDYAKRGRNVDGIINLRKQESASLEWIDKQGNTALTLACIYGDYTDVRKKIGLSQETSKNIAETLVELKANVNHRGHDGWTPLHHAVDNGHVDIVELLLNNGANTDTLPSLLEIAQGKGLTAIVNLLKESQPRPPSPRGNATPGPPSGRENATPRPLSARSNATPGPSSARENATHGPPFARGNATPGPPSTRRNATPGPPSAHGNATLGPPSARGNATPRPPSARGNATTGPPSARGYATPKPSSTRGNATPKASSGQSMASWIGGVARDVYDGYSRKGASSQDPQNESNTTTISKSKYSPTFAIGWNVTQLNTQPSSPIKETNTRAAASSSASYSPQPALSIGSMEDCQICKFAPSETTIIPCHHKACSSCLIEITGKKEVPHCPVCGKKIKRITQTNPTKRV